MPEAATLEPARAAETGRAEEREPSSYSERLLPPSEAAGLRRRWESIQTSFIDSPKESVEEANRLVADLSDRVAASFRARRTELEARWHRGEKISTEALRQSLQHYREFFDRLLHL